MPESHACFGLLFYTVKDERLLYELLVMKHIQFIIYPGLEGLGFRV